MSVCMIGIDYNMAELDVRSVFSFTKKKTDMAYAYFKKINGINGCVIISTCNRTELWLSTAGDTALSPLELLCGFFCVDAHTYSPYFTERHGYDAADHLFRLAAGLESKIIGEDQILTQVGEALQAAHAAYAADNTLEVLFRLAATAGKRVRTEASFSAADRSVIHTALDMLEQEGFSVAGRKCLVIGNGMMGKLSALAMMERGADVTMTVRQYTSGIVDIPKGCGRINYSERYDLLPGCELAVSATSSPNHTLRRSELERLEISRRIYLLDLAVPRDIEPEVRTLPQFLLYDIDSFNIDMISENLKNSITKAESIINEKKSEFYRWYECRDMIPMIQHIKKSSADDMFNRLSSKQKDDMEQDIKGAAERMMNKLLFGMRSQLSDNTFSECIKAMEKIFADQEK